MTKVVVDSDFWSRLNNPEGPVELCDPSGRTVGYLYPAPCLELASAKAMSPFSDEELLRREQEPGGRSLQEILRDLRKQ